VNSRACTSTGARSSIHTCLSPIPPHTMCSTGQEELEGGREGRTGVSAPG
jgi:hypothetical protein